jgi:hypothetical protein
MMRTNRNGSTLLEVMLLVSSTSVMLVLIMGFIHRTLDWSKETTKINDELRISQQATSRFHQDIQSASNVRLIDESIIEITKPDKEFVRYQILGNTLVRSEAEEPLVDGSAASANGFPPERFEFPADRVLKISTTVEKNGISLHLFQTAVDFAEPKELWCVDSYWHPPTAGANP